MTSQANGVGPLDNHAVKTAKSEARSLPRCEVGIAQTSVKSEVILSPCFSRVFDSTPATLILETLSASILETLGLGTLLRTTKLNAAQDTVFAHAHNSFFDCGPVASQAHSIKVLSTVREVSDSAADLASANTPPGLAGGKG